MRILVVDDELDIREFVQYNLVKEGYEVECAVNGRDALVKAAEFRPHLILMDMMMPEMDGREACRALRANPSTAKTMILFLSAVCEEDSLVECYEAGADDYMPSMDGTTLVRSHCLWVTGYPRFYQEIARR